MHRRAALSLAAAIAGAAGLFAQEPEQTPVSYEVAPPAPCAAAEAPAVGVAEAAPGHVGRFYGNVDYLLFKFRNGPAPALIQHLPTPAFAQPVPDANDAVTIFGGNVRYNTFNGVNFTAGMWATDEFAVEGSFSKFETKNNRFFIASPGDPSIGRFYIDTTNRDKPNTYVIYSKPDGTVSGYINAEEPLRFWQAEANVRGHGYSVFADRTDWLAGFRYLDLREGIFVEDFTQFNATGDSVFGSDRFYATNQFYGGQVGVNSFFDLGRGFSLDVTSKLAFGGVSQTVKINGVTIERHNGVITNVAAGDILTQPSNIGEYSRGRFAVIPELMVKLGYSLGSRLNVTVGYDVLTISSVVRAGSAIDPNVNPNLNPYLIPHGQSTAGRPGFAYNAADFWAQGLTLGVSLTY